MPDSRPFLLEPATGRPLHGELTLPDEPGRRPAVVVCHGFKGFFEWGFFPHLGELLALRGFAVVRFNFSGSGMRPGDERVTDPAAFRAATFGRDLEDLAAVLDAAHHGLADGRIDGDRLGLFGYSRGGGTALLTAAGSGDVGSGDAGGAKVRALVTWSSVGTFDRFPAADVERWRERGEVTVVNARTGQELPVGVEVLEELEAQREAFDLEAAAARRRVPWLIVHGEADETVPVEEARRLAAAAAEPAELLVVPGAGHTLGAVHPFAGPTPALIRALNATQRWFRRHLAAGATTSG